MPKIAISYRRADSMAMAGRIYDRLVTSFGRRSIFMDIGDIPYGKDFREHIDGILRQSDVLLAVVGTQWCGGEGGAARIFDEQDPVRVELQTALAGRNEAQPLEKSPPRAGGRIRIIPILVNDAKMPAASALPESLKEFAYLNALKVDAGADFHTHVDRLISALENPDSPVGIADLEPDAAPFSLPILVKYLAAPVVLLLLAHYLIVAKFNLDVTFLRLASIVIPLLSGLLLSWQDRRSLAVASVLGVGTALISVLGMQMIVAMIDPHATVLPSNAREWQEAMEFFLSISLSTVAGSLAARVLPAGLANIGRAGP